LTRILTFLSLFLVSTACASRRPPSPPLFPLSTAWQVQLDSSVVSPLAADVVRVYVAGRDGSITALDQNSGSERWRVEDRPGRVTATRGFVLVRGEDGTVWSLKPRDGGVRWRAETGIAGGLPVTLDDDRLYVAGDGLAALDVETGDVVWTQTTLSDVTAPPVATTARLLTGEADGTLYCRDRATGLPLWTYRTSGPILAPPLVDEKRRRVYLGTTEKLIRELKLDGGDEGWGWRIGADIQSGGLLLPDRVLFASFDAVLYGLTRGGNLAMRIPLPSRPLSGPLQVGPRVVIACQENEILAFDIRTGDPAGSLRTAAQIRTPPLVTGDRIFVGLRDGSVVALALPAGPAVAPTPPPDDPPPPEEPLDTEGPSDTAMGHPRPTTPDRPSRVARLVHY
jgi:outer membrane protein assembly factor BamB